MELTKVAKRLEVLNKAEDNEAVMYMYGSIGKGWFADISSKEIKNQLAKITAKTIHIHVNSPGGDVFESIAIGNLLKAQKAKIVVHIDGLAASGASVIAMAADEIIMPKNTMMMIHRAWTWAAGNSKDLRKIADDLEKIDAAVTESYTSRFVGERSELERLLADETWLTAEECKTFGFCDKVVDEVDEEEEKPTDEEVSAKDEILNKYSKNIVENSTTQQEQPQKFANALTEFFSTLNTPKR